MFHRLRTTIDLTDVEQIVELSQAKAIAQAIVLCKTLAEKPLAPNQLIASCMQVLDEKGMHGLSEKISGHLSQFRDLELACALNRLRTLRIDQSESQAPPALSGSPAT